MSTTTINLTNLASKADYLYSEINGRGEGYGIGKDDMSASDAAASEGLEVLYDDTHRTDGLLTARRNDGTIVLIADSDGGAWAVDLPASYEVDEAMLGEYAESVSVAEFADALQEVLDADGEYVRVVAVGSYNGADNGGADLVSDDQWQRAAARCLEAAE